MNIFYPYPGVYRGILILEYTMIKNSEFTVCDIVANMLDADLKQRVAFLTAKKDEQNIAVRDAVAAALSAYGKGEGNMPIAVTRKGMIIAGFVNPSIRDGEKSTAIATSKPAFEGLYHSKMYSRSFAADIARLIPYDMLRKYISGIESELSADVEKYVRGIFNSSMNNINKSFARERYNLMLSIRIWKNCQNH